MNFETTFNVTPVVQDDEPPHIDDVPLVQQSVMTSSAAPIPGAPCGKFPFLNSVTISISDEELNMTPVAATNAPASFGIATVRKRFAKVLAERNPARVEFNLAPSLHNVPSFKEYYDHKKRIENGLSKIPMAPASELMAALAVLKITNVPNVTWQPDKCRFVFSNVKMTANVPMALNTGYILYHLQRYVPPKKKAAMKIFDYVINTEFKAQDYNNPQKPIDVHFVSNMHERRNCSSVYIQMYPYKSYDNVRIFCTLVPYTVVVLAKCKGVRVKNRTSGDLVANFNQNVDFTQDLVVNPEIIAIHMTGRKNNYKSLSTLSYFVQDPHNPKARIPSFIYMAPRKRDIFYAETLSLPGIIAKIPKVPQIDEALPKPVKIKLEAKNKKYATKLINADMRVYAAAKREIMSGVVKHDDDDDDYEDDDDDDEDAAAASAAAAAADDDPSADRHDVNKNFSYVHTMPQVYGKRINNSHTMTRIVYRRELKIVDSADYLSEIYLDTNLNLLSGDLYFSDISHIKKKEKEITGSDSAQIIFYETLIKMVEQTMPYNKEHDVLHISAKVQGIWVEKHNKRCLDAAAYVAGMKIVDGALEPLTEEERDAQPSPGLLKYITNAREMIAKGFAPENTFGTVIGNHFNLPKYIPPKKTSNKKQRTV